MYSVAQNILVIHVAGLAQTTLALPALRSLRQHFPQSRISIVSSPVAADLLKLAGVADEILPIGRLKHAEILKPGVIYRSTRVWKELSHNEYDLALELRDSTESGIILKHANPHSRLSKSGTLNKSLGTVIERISRVLLHQPPKLIHAAHEYLKLLEPLGVRPVESEPRLITDRASDELIEKLLSKNGFQLGELLVGIHPGAGAGKQRWPLERFASIASRMIHNFNARIIVFAGPQERGMAKKLATILPAKRALPIESPKLTEFASAAARLSILVANLSGPAHLAAAVGTPVVAAAATAGPSSEDLISKYHEHIRGSHVSLISEEAVYEAACRLLKMNRADFLRAR
jgi:ADP-heptose:LPS heptosyltransferase